VDSVWRLRVLELELELELETVTAEAEELEPAERLLALAREARDDMYESVYLSVCLSVYLSGPGKQRRKPLEQ
jgi:hypothetical protein